MRMKPILLAGLGALFMSVMASCNKGVDEPNNNVEEGNTHAAVTLSFGENLFRADNEQNDFNPKGEWEGNDAIKTVDVYLVDDQKVSSGQYTIADFSVEAAMGQETKLMPKKAIKTTAGQKAVYVLVNAPNEIRHTLAVTTKADFETAWRKVYEAHNVAANTPAYAATATAGMKKLASVGTDGKDVIMMSNEKLYTFTVEANVTYDDAMKAVDPKNRAKVAVKRVAARVVVTTKQNSYDVVNPVTNQVIGKITDITYAVAQGEKKMNIQQVIDAGIIKTPAYDVITDDGFNNVETWKKMDAHYDYSDLFVKNRIAAVYNNGVGTPGEIGNIEQPAFILEANHRRHTAAGNTPATYDGGFFRGNTPYVLVRTKFKPTQEGLAAGEDINDLNPDGTFYLGTTTGKIYTSVANVVNPAKGGLKGQTYRKYVGGKVLYYAYVNPDNVLRPKTLDAPAFRNNVYHVHINDIKALGFNWNPLYPENPDDPNPGAGGNPGDRTPVNPDPRPNKENPNDPNDPGEDPIPPVKPEDPLGDKDIYMSVEVKVLKWNVHSYEVDLGL